MRAAQAGTTGIDEERERREREAARQDKWED
jgi:hypothetical protein